MSKIDISPLIDHYLDLSSIDNEADLDKLIKALRESGDEEIPVAELAKKMEDVKHTDKA